MAGTYSYSGQCHCGAVRVALTLTRPAGEIELRACQCGFCTRHGAATVSDPAGHARLVLSDPNSTRVYRFALRSAEPLICATCGVYVGTVLREGDRGWSVANVRALAMPEFDLARARPVSYDGETIDARIARRKSRWTPTTIRADAAG